MKHDLKKKEQTHISFSASSSIVSRIIPMFSYPSSTKASEYLSRAELMDPVAEFQDSSLVVVIITFSSRFTLSDTYGAYV